MKHTQPDIGEIYEVSAPNGSNYPPLVLDSPHSGTLYPADFGFSCPFDSLRLNEDQMIDDLYDQAAKANNVPFIKALFPRSYIDVNRAEDDILPELIDGNYPNHLTPTQKSKGGHGLISNIAGRNIPIYNRKLSVQEITHRLENYYHPYHTELDKILNKCLVDHGFYWHLDCHSMSSSTLNSHYAGSHSQPDFILGDKDGTSCDIALRRNVQSSLKDMGYQVAVNVLYKGVEIVKRYGDPAKGKNSLQIEINKSLYMNEATGKINNHYNQLKENIDKMVKHCAERASA
ncbi:MAG TPA: N-formylglutamate amidohydrolase [Alphaproteobacteria bacterium]|nr:N-formylglutamate amidohydrolase [Alphaproteobacteria bacterium]